MRYKTKVKCEDCGKLFSPQGLAGHRRTHKPKGQKKIPCEDCGKLFSKMGIGSHRWRAHGAGRDHKPTPPGVGHVAWNKGLTKETDPRVAANARSVARTQRKRVAEGTFTPNILTASQREAAARRMSRNNPGGRCKWFKVNGQRVQGTWERDLAQRMCELGVPWARTVKDGNRSWFYRDAQGKRRWYTPDFLLPEAMVQLEVKGFWWGNDRQKMDWVLSQNPEARIKIIEKDLFERLLVSPDRDAFYQTLGK